MVTVATRRTRIFQDLKFYNNYPMSEFGLWEYTQAGILPPTHSFSQLDITFNFVFSWRYFFESTFQFGPNTATFSLDPANPFTTQSTVGFDLVSSGAPWPVYNSGPVNANLVQTTVGPFDGVVDYSGSSGWASPPSANAYSFTGSVSITDPATLTQIGYTVSGGNCNLFFAFGAHRSQSMLHSGFIGTSVTVDGSALFVFTQ